MTIILYKGADMPPREAITPVLDTVWQRLAHVFRATAQAADYDPIEHHEARIGALEQRVESLMNIADRGQPPSRADADDKPNRKTKGNANDAD